jgi:hypothetical protein
MRFKHEPQRDRADLALFYTHRLLIYNIEIQNIHFKLGLDEEIMQRAEECSGVWKNKIAQISNRISGSTPEYQFCVGGPEARRSTVWHIWSRNGDVYIRSRMMGSQFILRESGTCQWSLTEDRARQTGAHDADRNFVWQRPEPASTASAHVFRIIIPESELREVSITEDTKQVKWLNAPPPGHAVLVECYLTPPLDSLDGVTFPYALLTSSQLPDSKWFVTLVHQEVMTEQNHHVLRDAREKIVKRVMDAGIELTPQSRAVAFIKGDGGVSGVIEMVPLEQVA